MPQNGDKKDHSTRQMKKSFQPPMLINLLIKC